jgi:hypothetical protein
MGISDTIKKNFWLKVIPLIFLDKWKIRNFIIYINLYQHPLNLQNVLYLAIFTNFQFYLDAMKRKTDDFCKHSADGSDASLHSSLKKLRKSMDKFIDSDEKFSPVISM